jgi:ankyrin repeat protein
VKARDSTGRTALIEAVFGGHKDAVELLLKRGAEVNGQDADGWTALMEAASKGRTQIVKQLLAHGADVDVSSYNGCTTLRVAARGNAELATLLRAAGNRKDRS